MRDRIFVDTNVLVYFISNHEQKKLQARDAIYSGSEVVVSSQVIGEFINTCLKKKLLGLDAVAEAASDFLRAIEFHAVQETTILKALTLVKKHKYSYWDSLIVAAALESGCSILHSEDLQDGQIIAGKLKIVNPFV